MTREQIMAAIPHRPPMLLIDEIVERRENGIVCRKQFSEKEFFFQGHYPGRPIVPGVILCEAAMQAGAVLLAGKFPPSETTDAVPVATRINDVKLRKMIKPGDTISIDVEIDEQLGNAYFLTARVTCDGKSAVRFQFACTMASPNP